MCSGIAYAAASGVGRADPDPDPDADADADADVGDETDGGRSGCANVDAASDGPSRLTRFALTIVRGQSSARRAPSTADADADAEMGLSASRSRFCDGPGEACGSGRSPTEASS